MASLTTGLIENTPVAGVRPTAKFAVDISNNDSGVVSVQILGYYLSGATKVLYVSELINMNPGSVTTRNYYAQFDAFEFQFITSSIAVEISAWGKNTTGNLVAAHRVLPAELNSLIPTGPTFITGVGAPTCAMGQLGDIYIDTSTGQVYLKLVQPAPVTARPIPPPTGTTLLVGSTRTYTTIQAALAAASNGDLLLLDAETFNITATINVNKSVTIEGQGKASTTVITTSLSGQDFMFNVTVPDVVFKDMKIVQNYPSVSSVETVIAVNDLTATDIYVDNCEISVCEIGIGIKATEFQITNCDFTYAPLASPNNGYFYILISSTSGESIIDNNTFVSDSGNTRCRFIIITNVSVSSGTLQGELIISNNTQALSPFTLRHLLVIEEFVGSNFELFINTNTTINEGNVPVLLFDAILGIFKFIEVVGNNVQNTAGKGLIGIDDSSTGTTDVFSSNNIIANQFFTAGWASATIPSSFIVGYNTTITPAPVLPLVSCYWLPLI
jgi:hypothetical protein